MSNRIQYLCDDWTCKTCGGSRWKGVPVTRADPAPASGDTGEAYRPSTLQNMLADAEKDNQETITALRAQLAETAVVQQQMGDRMKELLTLVEEQHGALVAKDKLTFLETEFQRHLDEENREQAESLLPEITALQNEFTEALAAYDHVMKRRKG